MPSLLASIREAVKPSATLIEPPEGDQPGKNASTATGPAAGQDKEIVMNDTDKPAATATVAEQADQNADAASARQEGERAATARLSAITSAEGIAGNAARMTAALDLAVKAPSMSAPDVTAFVTTHVAATAEAKPASPAALANRETHTALNGQGDQPAADRGASTLTNMRKLLGQKETV